MALRLSEETRARLDALRPDFPDPHSLLIPALKAAEEEFGHLSDEALEAVAEWLGVTPSVAAGVATFYHNLHTHPRGRHLVSVCRTLSCELAGAGAVSRRLQELTGVHPGGTTRDGLLTFHEVECLACCGTGPAVQVDFEYHESFRPEQWEGVLQALKEGRRPEGAAGIPADSTSRALDARDLDALFVSRSDKPPILMTPEAVAGLPTLSDYRERSSGYEGLSRVLKKMTPSEVTSQVKDSHLRGRGGAGFPAGTKWSFIPADSKKPVYLVCNADEGEPGTFKDRWLLRHNPHQLIEGILIAAYAVGSHHAFVYMRDEFASEAAHFRACLAEATEAGLQGADILGSGFDCRITLFMGAGAYICGEETALLNSLEGKRGYPRVRPPFPALEGLYGCPTVVNNVETLSNLPAIARNGGEWYASYGTKQSTGTRLFSISGRVARPGVYEVEMGIPWMDLIDGLAGGMSRGLPMKAIFPGGSSTPILRTEEVQGATIDFETAMKYHTFLGSGGTIVLDSGDDMVDVALNVSQFYEEETCGQCTPCREGCRWMVQIIRKFADGTAAPSDLDLLLDVAGHIKGNTICAFGDGAADPIAAAVHKFREDFEARIAGVGPAGRGLLDRDRIEHTGGAVPPVGTRR